jgi:hypothetical protein
LDSIVLTSFSGQGQAFFFGPLGSFLGLIGPWMTFAGGDRIGADLLPALLLSDPAHPARPPLAAGIYQVELVSAFQLTTYEYAFNVSAAPEVPTIPEPGTLMLTIIGVVSVAFMHLRRRATVAREFHDFG